MASGLVVSYVTARYSFARPCRLRICGRIICNAGFTALPVFCRLWKSPRFSTSYSHIKIRRNYHGHHGYQGNRLTNHIL